MASFPNPIVLIDPGFLLEQISDACILMDDRWRLSMVNQRAEGLLGRPRTDLLEQDFWKSFPEARLQGLEQQLKDALATGESVVSEQHFRKDGRLFVVRAHPTPNGLLVFFQDDTRRVENERRYRALVEHALDGITLVDADFQPFYRSPANVKVLGYDHETSSPMRPLALHPEDEGRIRRAVAVLAPDESITTEYRALHSNGEWLWLRGTFTNRLDDPAVQGIVINYSNITAERALRFEAEQRQLELAESHRQQQLRLSRLDTLHRVHLVASDYSDLAGTVRAMLSGAIKGIPSVAYAFLEDSGDLYSVAHYGLAVAAASLPDDTVLALAQRALDAGSTITVGESEALNGNDHMFRAIREAGLKGGYAVPFTRGGFRGVVMILAQSAMDTDTETLAYLSTLSGYIANAVATGRLLEQYERSVRHYGALANFGHQIERINDVNELVTTGLRELLVHLEMDNAALAALEGDYAVPRWRDGRATRAEEKLLWRPIPLEKGAVADAVRSGEAVLIGDYRSYDQRPKHVDPLGFTSVLVVPIGPGDAVTHVFILAGRNESKHIDETDLSIATLFANRLRNAFERVAHLEEVEATREATFRSLGLALEYRDYETKGHTDRVVELAMLFGGALHFNSTRLLALEWGAYLHDLGKLSIPDQILLKPGRLTDEEFELIKSHPVIGDEMSSGIPFLPQAARHIVRHHHERWDGTGYPDGLARQAIPLEARMFALVDVFDALTSDRPYRAAWNRERAIAYLREEAGSQFDPDLVETFLEVINSLSV